MSVSTKSPSRRNGVLIFLLIAAAVVIFFVVKHRRDAAAQAATAAGGATGGDGTVPADSAAGGGRHRGGAGGIGQIPAVPVQAQPVQNGTISASVSVTGNIDALHDITLSAKAPGRVLAINAREGDYVKAGQVVVQQDSTDLQATLRGDQALIASDEAKLSQAQENSAIQQTQSQQNVLNAQAALNAAKQNFTKLRRGNRPQDILQFQAAALQAKSTRDNALATYNRDKILLAQGAIAQATVDNDRSAYESNQALYLKAQAAQSEEEQGYQQEDINTAQEQVREQQANVANQVANRRLVLVSRGAIASAQAVLQQDHAKLAFDEQQVSNATIRSPIEGIVAARQTEPGELASAGTALVRIVNIDTLYFQPTISETDFAATHVGDPVQVTVDALPGRTFAGKVASLFPAADITTRVFSLRVLLPNSGHAMRPGMFARGTMVTRVARNVPVIPTSALVTTTSAAGFEANNSSDATVSQGLQLPPQQVVLLRPDQTAEVRPVKLGIVTMQRAEVTSGLQAGDQLIVVGQQGLKTGDKVTVGTAHGAPSGAGGASGGHGRRRGAPQ
jgi:HlyD family secretion protein